MTKMNKQRGPEPTSGTDYDSYLVPRSKTPAKNGIYAALLDLGWRFDSHTMEWWTPEDDDLQGRGRLSYDPDLTWARVVGPVRSDGTIPPPLIELLRIDGTFHWTPAPPKG